MLLFCIHEVISHTGALLPTCMQRQPNTVTPAFSLSVPLYTHTHTHILMHAHVCAQKANPAPTIDGSVHSLAFKWSCVQIEKC